MEKTQAARERIAPAQRTGAYCGRLKRVSATAAAAPEAISNRTQRIRIQNDGGTPACAKVWQVLEGYLPWLLGVTVQTNGTKSTLSRVRMASTRAEAPAAYSILRIIRAPPQERRDVGLLRAKARGRSGSRPRSVHRAADRRGDGATITSR